MALPHPAQDHAGHRQRGRQRHAHHVDQVVVVHPLAVGEPLGMHDHGHAQFDGTLPHRVVAAVVQVSAVHVGVDLEAAHAEVPAGLDHHLDGQLGMVHGQVGYRREPLRVLGHDLGEALMLEAAGLDRMLGVQPVEVLAGRDRQDLHVDALLVHVLDSGLGLLEPGHHFGLAAQLPVVAEALGRREERTRVHLGREVRLGQCRSRGYGQVGVHVDAQARRLGRGRTLPSGPQLRPPLGRRFGFGCGHGDSLMVVPARGCGRRRSGSGRSLDGGDPGGHQLRDRGSVEAQLARQHLAAVLAQRRWRPAYDRGRAEHPERHPGEG